MLSVVSATIFSRFVVSSRLAQVFSVRPTMVMLADTRQKIGKVAYWSITSVFICPMCWK